MKPKDLSTDYLLEEDRAESAGAPMQARQKYPHAAFDMLMCPRWDAAFTALSEISKGVVGEARMLSMWGLVLNRGELRNEIRALVDELFDAGGPRQGELALAWQMLTGDPNRPPSFRFLPQVQHLVDTVPVEDETHAELQQRLRVWWQAACGDHVQTNKSIFALTEEEFLAAKFDMPVEKIAHDDPIMHWGRAKKAETAAAAAPDYPSMVVLKSPCRPNKEAKHFSEIVDQQLRLVTAEDIETRRKRLHREFPHAVAAIDMVLRDLREGRPITIRPVILSGPRGCGKSRLAQRIGEMFELHVAYYDGGSSMDGMFAGTSKTWSNSEPSLPLRAIEQSRTANVLVFVDEIDKAAENGTVQGGSLWRSLHGYLDRSTSKKYRDKSLDAEADLSAVSYISTANDVTRLPATLRDRCRILRVPAPTPAHLPQLAASIVNDMALEDELFASHAVDPFAQDELAVMARAWVKAGCSIRPLQKIVKATIDARDASAMRH